MAEAESSPSRPDAESTPPSSWVATAWPYALLLAVGIFVLTPKLGDFGFWDPWEPKYAESAREMIERGDFIVPYYREEVRLAKPILVYWGILAGSAVFGLNEFGARIVGVCMALASMLGVFYAVSLLRGRQAGLISALVLGTAPHFYFISRQAMPDVYLFTSLGSCLIFLCLGLFGPDRRRDLHFGISYACFSLAVLAKGPVIAGAILLTTLVIYGLIRIDTRELWQRERRAETLLYFGTLAPTIWVSPWARRTGSSKRSTSSSSTSRKGSNGARLGLFGVCVKAGLAWMPMKTARASRSWATANASRSQAMAADILRSTSASSSAVRPSNGCRPFWLPTTWMVVKTI